MTADGAGVIIYAKPEQSVPSVCARGQRVDSVLIAGLLRATGVSALRLIDGRREVQLRGELRSCGLHVAS